MDSNFWFLSGIDAARADPMTGNPCGAARNGRLLRAGLRVRIYLPPAKSLVRTVAAPTAMPEVTTNATKLVSVEMARHGVTRTYFFAHRRFVRALGHGTRATRVEAAARRRVESARHLAANGEALDEAALVNTDG